MNHYLLKRKSCILAMTVIAACYVVSCAPRLPPETEKLRNDQFVTDDVFLSITNGSSLAEVTNVLGSAVRHQFTVAESGHTWTLISCFLHTGEEESYTFYMPLFRDNVLIKTIGWIQMESEEYAYRGTTAMRSKPWRIEDTKYVRKALEAPEVTHEQVRAEVKDAHETMEKYKGQGNIPAIVGYFLARPFIALEVKGYPVNEALRRKFNGGRVSIGMTSNEVYALYGEPLYVFTTKESSTARIYGDDQYLGNAVESFLIFSYVAVLFDPKGLVKSVYSDAFFCKDWYPNMPSWRRY